MGVGPIDRVAQRNDEFGIREYLGNTTHGAFSRKVVGRGFTQYACATNIGELVSVPVEPAIEPIREELELLGRHEDIRVGVDVAVQRCRACAHRTEHDEVGKTASAHPLT